MNFSSPLIRAIEARVDDVDKKKKTITARLNSCALDRYMTVIDARGMDLRAFRNNPTMLFEHGLCPTRGAMPAGVWRKVWQAIGPDGPELLGTAEFFRKADGKGDDFTERLFQCYADGDMKAFSVRVIPRAGCGPPTREEIRARPELADCVCMYRSTELAEASCVAVGGNADCLTVSEARSVLKLVSRGLALKPGLVRHAGWIVSSSASSDGNLPPLAGRPAGDVRAAFLREAAGALRDTARGIKR
jgi:hypothetical protein